MKSEAQKGYARIRDIVVMPCLCSYPIDKHRAGNPAGKYPHEKVFIGACTIKGCGCPEFQVAPPATTELAQDTASRGHPL